MKARLGKILICFMLCLSLFLSVGTVNVQAADDGTTAVYVVFDNSGSMYTDANFKPIKAWSQATYAVEVFASMLDYENGDKMEVFTMWPVITESGAMETYQLHVNNLGDIQQIHSMYCTEENGSTPFEIVETAAEALVSASADEKWLVILTDGQFSQQEKDTVAQKMESFTAQGIHVQYLGIGSGAWSFNENAQNYFFADNASSSEAVVTSLTGICNRIFERNAIDGYTAGQTLQFDIPISKVIVFAQGENVQINGMCSAAGETVFEVKRFDAAYSTSGGVAPGSSYEAVTDTTLKGTLVTYANPTSLQPGDYMLDVSGADNINVYYEPDVKFGVVITDGENVYSPDQMLTSGEYTLMAGFVDQSTGQLIDGSVLLGDAVYEISINGNTLSSTVSNGQPASFPLVVEAGTYNVEGKVTYLNDYTDQFATSYSVESPIPLMTIELMVPSDTTISELENSAPVTVRVLMDGEPMSAEEWNNCPLPTVDCRKPVDWTVEKGTDVSTFNLYPHYHNGDRALTATGEIPFQVLAATTANGEALSAEAEGILNVAEDRSWQDRLADFIEKYLPWLIALLVLLILLILLIIFLNTKVMPKRITCSDTSFTIQGMTLRNAQAKVSLNGKRLVITSPQVPSGPHARKYVTVTADLKPESPRRIKSSRRKVTITKIHCNNVVNTKVTMGDIFEWKGREMKQSGSKITTDNPFVPVRGIGDGEQIEIRGVFTSGNVNGPFRMRTNLVFK